LSSIFISDIEFISAYRKSEDHNAFSKAGYDIIPYVSGYFPTEVTSLMFYAEIYRTADVFGEGEPFVYTLCVLDAADNAIESCKKIKREKSIAVLPLIQSVNIGELGTGEYKLRVEVQASRGSAQQGQQCGVHQRAQFLAHQSATHGPINTGC